MRRSETGVPVGQSRVISGLVVPKGPKTTRSAEDAEAGAWAYTVALSQVFMQFLNLLRFQCLQQKVYVLVHSYLCI